MTICAMSVFSKQMPIFSQIAQVCTGHPPLAMNVHRLSVNLLWTVQNVHWALDRCIDVCWSKGV